MAKSKPKRRTCFVMMPFDGYDTLYEEVIQPIVESSNLDCVIADHSFTGPVLDKIEQELIRATLCVAEVSDQNPNVMYEVGLARMLRKQVILLNASSKPPAFDIRHMQMIQYTSEADGFEMLRTTLAETIERTVPLRLIGRMLAPERILRSDIPFVIAASPLSWRVGRRRSGGFKSLTSTSGDNYGIRSLIHEFAYVFGPERPPELIDPEDYEDSVVSQKMNLYTIGSPKANRWTGDVLKNLNETFSPQFEFVADRRKLQDVEVRLLKDGKSITAFEPEWERDCGLIIRAQNPFVPGTMVTILAGCRSTGTEAACRAATDARILTMMQQAGCDLDHFDAPFYALVSLERHGKEESYKAKADEMELLESGPLESH